MDRRKAEWLALALLVIGLAALALVQLWPSGPDLSDLETALEETEEAGDE